MNSQLFLFAIGIIIASLVFMVRNDTIGYIGGGVLSVIGLITLYFGATTDD